MTRAQDFGFRLAEAIEPGLDEVIETVYDTIRVSLPDLDIPGPNGTALQESCAQNVRRVLAVVRGDVEPSHPPPDAALEYARGLAATAGGLPGLLRSYRVGEAIFIRHCMLAAERFDVGEITVDAQVLAFNRITEYSEQVTEQVTRAYEAAHEHWLQTREGSRHQMVSRILWTWEDLDVAAAEQTLNYPLSGPHVALKVWADPQATPEAIDQTREVLASRSRADASLQLRREERTSWIWLHTARPIPQWCPGSLPNGVRAAVGSIRSDMDGFRRSQIEAQVVAGLMASARHQPTTATWREIAPVAAMAADPEGLRGMVTTMLGPLADGTHEDLCDTLRVFLETNRSHLATGEQLHLHRNTVTYRVRKALDLCPGTGEPDSFGLLAALHADRWLPPGTEGTVVALTEGR
ncbi:MAG: helix-turn-helix domain-containing protein [Actinomycetia bacterium]|nr:helix-turn-helix domain-containing protein [Actinomycetes bacterium]